MTTNIGNISGKATYMLLGVFVHSFYIYRLIPWTTQVYEININHKNIISFSLVNYLLSVNND